MDLPDLRSFGPKGVDYGHKELDRAERDYQDKIDEARSNADEETEASAHGHDREAEFYCDETDNDE